MTCTVLRLNFVRGQTKEAQVRDTYVDKNDKIISLLDKQAYHV